MTITITNSGASEVNEYAAYSGTFTCTDSLAGTETIPNVVADPLAIPPVVGVTGSGVFYEHPKIVKVTSSIPFASFNINVTGDNTVEYSGSFDDAFERHWKYVLADNTKGDVPKVSQLPPEYLALYAFIPPAVNSIVVTLSFYAWTHDTDASTSNNPAAYTGKSIYSAVPVNLSTITAPQMTLVGTQDITVKYVWPTDVAAFKAALPMGTLYQQALAKGLVG